VALLLALSFLINQLGNKKVAGLRKERREYMTKADKDVVRLIMSKTEVLQNQKI
jgi:hypothetical protein